MENQLVGSSKSLHFLGPRHRCRWSPQSRWKFSAAMAPYGTGSRSQGSTESTFFSSYLRRNVVPCGTWGLPKGFRGWEMMGIPWSSNVFTKWWGNSDESFLEWWAALFLDTISEQPQGGNHVSLPATFVSSAACEKNRVHHRLCAVLQCQPFLYLTRLSNAATHEWSQKCANPPHPP